MRGQPDAPGERNTMMTVEDILMKKGPDVIVAPPQCTVLEAAKLMSEADVGSLIVRRDRQVLGIFTERDLLRRVVAAGKDPHAGPYTPPGRDRARRAGGPDQLSRSAGRLVSHRRRSNPRRVKSTSEPLSIGQSQPSAKHRPTGLSASRLGRAGHADEDVDSCRAFSRKTPAAKIAPVRRDARLG